MPFKREEYFLTDSQQWKCDSLSVALSDLGVICLLFRALPEQAPARIPDLYEGSDLYLRPMETKVHFWRTGECSDLSREAGLDCIDSHATTERRTRGTDLSENPKPRRPLGIYPSKFVRGP